MGCTYCNGPHIAYKFQVITDCQERWSIIKGVKLYSNCLGNQDTFAINERESITQASAQAQQQPTHPQPLLLTHLNQQSSSQTLLAVINTLN